MSNRRKYDKPKAGEWIYPRRRGYRLACCDCGLVHIVNHRLTRRNRIEMQFFIDKRATAASRRRAK